MSKIALITDTHHGARSDSQAFDAHFEKFYTELFFPTLKERGIKQIVHLGDVFDRRKFVNFTSLNACRRYFFDAAKHDDIEVTIITGNHDVAYKNTNKVNSPDLLLKDYSNVFVYSEPAETLVYGRKILMVPWINAENYAKASHLLKESNAEVCFGHFEIEGFSMHKGQPNEGGMTQDVFKNFQMVCSGHFHHRSSNGNIHYLGAPYQYTWIDHGDPKGFHIFDTDTLELEFIENTNTIFEKIYYNDVEGFDIDPLAYANKNIKLIVVNKTDFYKFDKVVDSLYDVDPIELKIIEDFTEFELEVQDDSVNIEDTISLLSTYVDSIETDVDKDKLKTVLKTLYVEAQTYTKET